MGKLIYSMMVSLDGFVETPRREIDWVIVDEEMHTLANDQARKVDAFLYGRRMYELMSDFWPAADQDPAAPGYIVDFARIWRAKPKVVYSQSLERVDWNSRLVREVVAEEIVELKKRGGDLGVGGPTLAATFIRLGLVDEFHLFVNPTILGGGTPFLPALDHRLSLRLAESRALGSGVVYLRYQNAFGEP